MPHKKQRHDEAEGEFIDLFGRFVGAIVLLYLLALIGSWLTNRAHFWKLAAYGLLTGVCVVGAFLGWRQIQVKLRLRKIRKIRDSIQRKGQEEYILNFINRFRMEGEGKRGWSFRNHHFDWNRISDLEKVLVERGVPLNLEEGKRDIFTVLRLFIQEKEENITRASIQKAPQLDRRFATQNRRIYGVERKVDKVITQLDAVLKKSEDHREEDVSGAEQLRRHDDQLQDHAVRIKKLETIRNP